MAEKLVYKLEHLKKEIDGRTIVNVASLSISSGELWAIVGPSGAGKSTLLRMLHFLDSPTSGKLIYRGNTQTTKINAITAQRRRIGTVFQRPELLEGTVRENIEFSLRIRKMKNFGRVHSVLEKLELTHLSDAQVHTLSGGEMQRVALARVLIYEPDILLLDEPTANLDPHNVELIENIIKQQHLLGKTILLVTHNIFQARRLAQYVGLMLNGQMIEISKTEKFFTAPNDPRALAFANGEMIY